MPNRKSLSNFLLGLCLALTFSSIATGQNNLTARANSLQPQPTVAVLDGDRVRDGLLGPVRRVRTEVAKLSNANGRTAEDKRVLLEIASYDNKGAKIENSYFPIAGSTLTGQETYKYDDKGNISEMTLLNADGSLLSKEVYKYDYDQVGNWTRMTTSVAVVEGGKVTFEPTEVTYRAITYYLDQNMVAMVQPPAAPAASPGDSSTNRVATGDTKPQLLNATPKSQPVADPRNNKLLDPKPSVAKNRSIPAPSATAADGSKALDSAKLMNLGPVKSDTQRIVLASEPPPGPKPLLKPISGGVLNGNAVSLPPPVYPEAARRLHVAGMVSVDVVVDETGKVISAQTTSGPATLRGAAIQAALRARFTPTKLSGQPVKISGVITYKFSLAQ